MKQELASILMQVTEEHPAAQRFRQLHGHPRNSITKRKFTFCFSSSSDQCIKSSKRALTIRFQWISQVCAMHAALASTSTSLQHATLGNSIPICFYVPQETRNPKVRVRAQSASTWFSASGLTALMQSITRTMYDRSLWSFCSRVQDYFYSCSAGDRLQSWEPSTPRSYAPLV